MPSPDDEHPWRYQHEMGVPLSGTRERVASFDGAMTSLESILIDASPNSGHLTIPSGQVQLSPNVRPLSAATRFSMMIAARTIAGSSDGHYNVPQGGIR